MSKWINIFGGGGVRLLNSTAASRPSPLSRFSVHICSSNGLKAPRKGRRYATAFQFPYQNYSWPSTRSFTPYEVLNVPRDGTYSKRNYYDLVKIYHPDRPLTDHPIFHQLTPEIRLQRYRIVVEANEILSDPIKRAAYDRSGLGWSHTAPDTKIEWESRGPNIYANATWEDWEDWHNRHRGPQQHVVDHRTFVRLVILLVLFGAALQASWIGQMNTGVQGRVREVHEKSAHFLHSRQETAVKQMNSNDARVQGFLIRRDPTGSGLKDHEQPIYQQELNPRRGLNGSSQVEDLHSQEPAQLADAKLEHSDTSSVF
ncbi:hypothetical protein N7535_004130 [Penicillium sp. DV-2018c]|nr:hypothetical protein N7461_000164 [Penicillium sp. DV-2018c]KAJ5577204.1 hypothetical protein N7535_004130 [Penicillium sp. DV-2018c]